MVYFAANQVKIRTFWEDLLGKNKNNLIWKHSEMEFKMYSINIGIEEHI